MTRAGAVKSDEGVLPDDGMLVFAGAFLYVTISSLLTVVLYSMLG